MNVSKRLLLLMAAAVERDTSSWKPSDLDEVRGLIRSFHPHEHYKTTDEISNIRTLFASGMKQKEIAKKLGIQARTVRKYCGKVYQAGIPEAKQ